MRTQIADYDHDTLIDLIRGITEISGNLRTNAFDPVPVSVRADYRRKMKILSIIAELLDEYGINIKSRGYTFITDAVCIVIDMQTLDICFNADVYPYIADKYRIKKIDMIEHSIRNAIAAGYARYKEDPCHDTPLRIYSSKPTNKRFILHIAREAAKRCGEYA